MLPRLLKPLRAAGVTLGIGLPLLAATCPTDGYYRVLVQPIGSGSGRVTSGPYTCVVTPDDAGCPPDSSFAELSSYRAEAGANSVFAGWMGHDGVNICGDSTAAVCEFRGFAGPGTQYSIRPRFTYVGTGGEHALLIRYLGSYHDTPFISSADGRIACPRSPSSIHNCSAWYRDGATVTLMHAAQHQTAPGEWLGCTSAPADAAQCALVIVSDTEITMDYRRFRTISVRGLGLGAGTVTSTPAGLSCAFSYLASPPCSFAVKEEDDDTYLTATPAPGSNGGFNVAGLGFVTDTPLPAHGDATIDVIFNANSLFALNVIRAGTGQGGVTSNPVGIDCANFICSASFGSGTSIVLTATPNSGSTFTGWSGAGCTGTGTCTVIMNAETSVTATFSLPAPTTFALNVALTGTGQGLVTSTPSGINCASSGTGGPGACSASYGAGTNVALTAAPNAGFTFTGWSGGGCSGTGTCSLTMNAATSVQASFAQQAFVLAITGAGTGSGTVTELSSGINCAIAASVTSGSCTGNVTGGMVVFPQAAASQGSVFAGWSGDCGGTGPCAVQMNQTRAVTATFTSVPTFTLTIRQGSAITGNATVVSSPGSIACTFTNGQLSGAGTCAFAFPVGTAVTLTAGVAPPSTFGTWTGVLGCSFGNPVCVVTMDQDRTVDVIINP